MTGAVPLSGGRHGSIALLLRVQRRDRGHPAGRRSRGRLRLRAAALLLQRAGRMVGRRRARPDGRLGLLRRGERARARRECRRVLLPRPAAAAAARAGRCRQCAAGRADLRLCRLQRHQAGIADGGPDHRLRPAAGADVLSDGRRRAVHDGVRDRPALRAAASRHRQGPRCRRRRHRPLSRLGLSVAVHRCRRRAR